MSFRGAALWSFCLSIISGVLALPLIRKEKQVVIDDALGDISPLALTGGEDSGEQRVTILDDGSVQRADLVQASSGGLRCVACDDVPAPFLTREGLTCASGDITGGGSNDLGCNRKPFWRRNHFCRTTCARKGLGYDDQDCCVPAVPVTTTSTTTSTTTTSTTSSPPSTPNDCVACDDVPAPFLTREGLTCANGDITGGGSNDLGCNRKPFWRRNHFCRTTCARKGLGYDDQDCCVPPTPPPSENPPPSPPCVDTDTNNVACSTSATSTSCASQAWKTAGTCSCTCKRLRPHMIFFLIDDLGYADFVNTMPECDSGAGSSGCPWQHLQKMMSNSVFIDSTYTEAVCAPTRSSFMNGRWRHLMIDAHRRGYDWGSTSVSQERSIAQKVKEYDYKAYAIGKWHVGERHYLFTPTGRGFHRYYGQWTNSDHFQHCHYKRNRGFDLHYQEQGWSDSMDSDIPYHRYVTEGIGKYSTELYTEAAYRFLKEHQTRYPDTPFFLYYAMYALHTPMEAPPTEGSSLYSQDYYTIGGCTDARYPNPKRKSLCAMNAALDVALANLTSLLETQFAGDNYLVVITGDNGGCVGCGSINAPLTGSKGLQYEGGIRNHAVVWGNSAELDSVKGKPYKGGFMHLVDWHATFVELASLGMTPGASHTPTYMSGQSVWQSIVEGTASPVTRLISASENSEKYRDWYIREGDWKLKIDAENWTADNTAGAMELYNLGEDVTECEEDTEDEYGVRRCSKNLIDSNTQKRDELMDLFKSMKLNQRVTNGNEDLDSCPTSNCVNDEAAALKAEFTDKGIVPCAACTESSGRGNEPGCYPSSTIAYPEKSGFPENTASPEYWAGE